MLGSASDRPGASAPPILAERLGAFVALLAAVVCAVATVPFTGADPLPLPGVTSLVFTALTLAALFSSALLATLNRLSQRQPTALLSLAYGFATVFLVCYVLALPGVVLPSSERASTIAEWLWVGAHAGFAALAVAYALSEWIAADPERASGNAPFAVRSLVFLTVVGFAVTASAALFAAGELPRLTVGEAFTPLLTRVVGPGLLAVYCVALAAFAGLTRLRSKTQVWFGVVLGALACEVFSAGVVASARYSVPWYAGCAEGVVAAAAFLVSVSRQLGGELVTFASRNRVLADSSVRDALTQALNRRGFDARLAEFTDAQRRRNASSLALAIVDIDYFKRVNDTFGHVAGDQVLRSVAQAIGGACSRGADACFRIGGEEFAVLLPVAGRPGAEAIAERIRASVADLKIPGSSAVDAPVVTVSVGVAVVEAPGECSGLELYRRADEALLAAKRGGRDRVVVFDKVRSIA